MNSSRAGVVEGIARRGAADRVADISAGIRSDAWNRGLNMAEDTRRFGINGLSSAASQFGSMATSGAGMIGAGMDANYRNLDAATRAGQMDQADRQGSLDADFQKWQGQDNRASELLKRYQSVVGANNWGGESTTEQVQETPTGGLFGDIMGIATGGLGIASGLGWKPFAKGG